MSVPYRIPPTTSDIQIANIVAEYTSPRTERAAEWLTWGADEHVLLAIAATPASAQSWIDRRLARVIFSRSPSE
jgi:hypothetical protein